MLSLTVKRAAVALALVLVPFSAYAQRAAPPRNQIAIDVGGRVVRLLLPKGQCRLDQRQPFDAAVINTVLRSLAGANELLMYVANCDDLLAARTGRALNLFDFSQAQVGRDFRRRDLRGQESAAAREICQSYRTAGDQLQQELGTADQRVARIRGGLAANETKSLGVLGEDEVACYSGIINRAQEQNGDVRLTVSIFANVVLNGRLIYLYRYKVNPKPGELDELVNEVTAWAREHAKLNNPPAPPRR